MVTLTRAWRWIIATYTIKSLIRLEEFVPYAGFFGEKAREMAEAHGNKFDPSRFVLERNHRLTICLKDDRPVGFMLARLSESIFDFNVVVLVQDLLYAEPGTKAAKLLLDDFIDFGRRRANHIVTMIGERTNIKERSLKRLGFKKLETIYRIEV